MPVIEGVRINIAKIWSMELYFTEWPRLSVPANEKLETTFSIYGTVSVIPS